MFNRIAPILLSLCLLAAPLQVFAVDGNIDISNAQTSVGKRFAKVFCEAKKGGVNSETASEYALNNTYLKFVAFPDDEKFVEDLWKFTLERIRKSCGEYVTANEEKSLRDFFEEEGEIASNRDLYLPH